MGDGPGPYSRVQPDAEPAEPTKQATGVMHQVHGRGHARSGSRTHSIEPSLPLSPGSRSKDEELGERAQRRRIRVRIGLRRRAGTAKTRQPRTGSREERRSSGYLSCEPLRGRTFQVTKLCNSHGEWWSKVRLRERELGSTYCVMAERGLVLSLRFQLCSKYDHNPFESCNMR